MTFEENDPDYRKGFEEAFERAHSMIDEAINVETRMVWELDEEEYSDNYCAGYLAALEILRNVWIRATEKAR